MELQQKLRNINIAQMEAISLSFEEASCLLVRIKHLTLLLENFKFTRRDLKRVEATNSSLLNGTLSNLTPRKCSISIQH